MTSERLTFGGRIDRNKTVHFTWDGRRMEGHPGDTLASALMANNEQVIGRSFKYHRPRGVMSAGVEESGAIVTLGQGETKDPNVKATMQELYDGLTAFGQNAWPNVRFDFGFILNSFSRFLAAGFYYKTFMGLPPFVWGRGTDMWMIYEKFIRHAAGMGTASREPDPDRYDHGHLFCDVLVVGSGPAGLSAACRASEVGLDVLLVEQDFEIGGDYLNQKIPPPEFTKLLLKIQNLNVRTMARTTAFGLYDNTTSGLLERVTDHLGISSNKLPRQKFWIVRSKIIILATGALERHFAFGNNDMPGIMTASAAKAYLHRFGVLAGKNIILTANNDSAYDVACSLSTAGASVELLDVRSDLSSELPNRAREVGVNLTTSCAALKACGSGSISTLETARFNGTRWIQSDTKACDLLLISGGWSPVIDLVSQRGSKASWNDQNACFLAGDIDEPIHLAGSAVGIWEMSKCELSGEAAGRSAANALGASLPSNKKKIKSGGWSNKIYPLYEVKLPGKRQKSFVDFQHDVIVDDIRLAHQEGFVSIEHLKRYTTLGMAIDQGKIGNVIGIGLMAEAMEQNMGDVGTTSYRPPYTPISLGALSGRNTGNHFRPLRRTPMDKWNLDHNATMTDAGLWRRPWFFARDGETINEAYIREADTVRNAVGLCDVTTLGKIAIQGPDSAEFINRIYTNSFAKLAIGKARYGIMLRDDGVVMDDGTTWRLGENNYFLTTTTANAARVLVWLEELLQIRWSDLKVHVTSVSEEWAGCAVAGPLSRKVLEAVIEAPDLVSNEKLPFMGVIETKLKNEIPCRIARISFSGEMASEVYVPADYGPSMMELLWQAAKKQGGCLYGLEALETLRIEKGHVTGAELDGRTTVEDVGLGKMASPNKDFVGNVLRKRPFMIGPDRARLVGIFPEDQKDTFNAGAILCSANRIFGHGEGWITGVTYSPVFGHWIGLGFIKGGHERWLNKSVVATDPTRKKNIRVKIGAPQMYEPEGTRHYG